MKAIRNGCSKLSKAASCSTPRHATRGQRHVVRGQKQPNREFKGFGSAPKSSSAKPKLPTTADPKLTAADTPGAVDVVTGQTEQQVTAFTSEDTWRQLDEKVNKYPMERTFTAIGSGGDDFRGAMLGAVRSVLGEEAVPEEVVACRPSSNDKYISVKIGPVTVQDADQVVAVYTLIKADERVKFCT